MMVMAMVAAVVEVVKLVQINSCTCAETLLPQISLCKIRLFCGNKVSSSVAPIFAGN